MTKTREWDRDAYPEADHELSDAEIETRYGALLREFIADIATAGDFHTLTRMAKTADGILRRRAQSAERAALSGRFGVVP